MYTRDGSLSSIVPFCLRSVRRVPSPRRLPSVRPAPSLYPSSVLSRSHRVHTPPREETRARAFNGTVSQSALARTRINVISGGGHTVPTRLPQRSGRNVRDEAGGGSVDSRASSRATVGPRRRVSLNPAYVTPLGVSSTSYRRIPSTRSLTRASTIILARTSEGAAATAGKWAA